MADVDNPYTPPDQASAKSAQPHQRLSAPKSMLVLAGWALLLTYCVGLAGSRLPPSDSPGLFALLPLIPMLLAARLLLQLGMGLLLIIIAFPIVALVWLVVSSGRLIAIVPIGVGFGIINGLVVRWYLGNAL